MSHLKVFHLIIAYTGDPDMMPWPGIMPIQCNVRALVQCVDLEVLFFFWVHLFLGSNLFLGPTHYLFSPFYGHISFLHGSVFVLVPYHP